MKKIKLFIFIIICLYVANVKADMGPPSIVQHDVMVTNKDGAVCYENDEKGNYKKTSKVIPYKTTLSVIDDIMGGYINVYHDDNDNYNCVVKYSDISAKNQSFELKNKDVEKITPVNAVVLAKGGLNMRKGPAVTYSKIMTVPQYAIIKLSYRAGDYWYYGEYNGKTGWITGMDGYFGYDGKEVLYNYEEMKIYSTYDRKAVIGKIPANTEITDYINLVTRSDYDISHYVIYKGTKGYIDKMLYKTDGVGKIKLLKNYDVTTKYGELIKKLTPQELEYNMVTDRGLFYLTSKKIVTGFPDDYFDYIKKVDVSTKDKGYIGEGLFGEEKRQREEIEIEKEEAPIIDEEKSSKDNQNNGVSTKDIIIICLLAGIFISLMAIVIIKLVNSKKVKQIQLSDKRDLDE